LYGSAKDHEFLAGDGGPDVKLERILRLAISLGLRCPSEYTLKYLASWWMVTTHSSEELSELTFQNKLVLLAHVKKSFDNHRKKASDPSAWVDKLPLDPLEYLLSFPSMYHNYYKDGAKPSQPTFSSQVVADLDNSYSCRGGLTKLPTDTFDRHRFSSSALAPSGSSSSSSSGDVNLQNMLTMMMTMFQQMHRPVQSSADSVLNNFVDHRRPHRRMPTLGFDDVGSPSGPPTLAIATPSLALVPAAPKASLTATPPTSPAAADSLTTAYDSDVDSGFFCDTCYPCG
jgi:hypothetical protein